MNGSRKTLFAYLACAIIWGTTWFAIRESIGPGGYPTVAAVALRFSLAALVLAPFAWFARPWPRAHQWGWLIVAGFLDAAGYALIYLGEREVTGGLAAVLFGTQPLILTALMFATRMEEVRPMHVVSAVVALLGVGIIFADQLEVSRGQALGVIMLLGSVVVSTLYTVVIKRHGGRIHALASTTTFVGVTAVFLWIAVVMSGEAKHIPWPPPVQPTLWLAYLAVFGTAIGFGAYFWLLSRVTLLASNLLGFVVPLIALAVDALFEARFKLGAQAYLGAAITLLAVALSQVRSPDAEAASDRQ